MTAWTIDRINQDIRETGHKDIDQTVKNILNRVAKEANNWTSRFDDARRIPDVIAEIAQGINSQPPKETP